MGRARSPRRRVRDDDFMLGLSSDYPRIVFILAEAIQCNLELKDFVAGAVFGEVRGWLCLLRALEMTFHMWRGSIMRFILRGRRSIWWTCRVTFVAPRIVNDVSYVTPIYQGLFCVAGAVFGEVGVLLFVAGAALGEILIDSRSAKCCIFFHTKCVCKVGRGRSPRRRVRDDDFMLGLSSDYPRIVFILAEAIQGVSHAILNLQISWQVQYLVRLEGDFACSAHWKRRFICDADQSWDSFCVAGAVFGELVLWRLLLRAM